MPKTYTVKQVANILGYSTNSIYSFLKEGRLKGVRVGKGRFRIPQVEIDGLLGTRGGQKTVLQTDQGVDLANGSLNTSDTFKLQDEIFSEKEKIVRIKSPSLFDFFVGTSGVLVGLTLFLFLRFQSSQTFDRFQLVFPILRISLICGGVGILVVDIFNRYGSLWQKFFNFLLIFAYGGLALILIQTNELGTAALVSSMILVILVGMIYSEKRLEILSVYLWVTALTTPLVTYLLSSDAGWYPTIGSFTPSAMVMAALNIVFAAIGGLICLGASKRGGVQARPTTLVPAVLLILFSLWFALFIAWVKVILLLMAGVVGFFISYWRHLPMMSPRDRAGALGILGIIQAMFLVSILIVLMIQQSVANSTNSQLYGKVRYGRVFMETTLDSLKKSVSSVSKNPQNITALKDGNVETLNGNARTLFEGNPYLRRVMFFSTSGTLVTTYPEDPVLLGQSGAEREYFKQSLAKPGPFVSGVFNSTLNNPVVVVSAAAIDPASNEPVGVVATSLDLGTLGRRLQEMTVSDVGEYFVVVDNQGMRIFHPTRNLINTPVAKDDLVRLAIAGHQGTGFGFNYLGERMFQAHAPIKDTGWGIEIQAPVLMIMARSSGYATVILSLLTLGSFGVAGYFFVKHIRVVGKETE